MVDAVSPISHVQVRLSCLLDSERTDASITDDVVTVAPAWLYFFTPDSNENGLLFIFFFSSRRRHTRCSRDWSSDVCSSDLLRLELLGGHGRHGAGEIPPVGGTIPDRDDRIQLDGTSGQLHIRHGLLAVLHRQIGRASCRERV